MLVVLVVATVIGACGDGERRAEDQPVPTTDRFGTGIFDEIPRFPRSDPLGPRHQESDVVAQSFRVVGARPEQILDYYEENLVNWELITPPRPPGETSTTLRGRWARDRWILTISATTAPTLENENHTDVADFYSQYSLSLAPGPPGEAP